MYKFKSGPLKGMTVKMAVLRNPSHLYEVVHWAKRKELPQLVPVVAEFERLRKRLSHAAVVVRCSEHGCDRQPTAMTLPLDGRRCYLPLPYFWCRKHEPLEWDGISPKLPISLDSVDAVEDKKSRTAVHRAVLDAWGIRRHRARISERFAQDFFAGLK